MREEDRTGEESAGEARKGEEMRVQERKGEESICGEEKRVLEMKGGGGECDIGEESTRETSICKEKREECRREEYVNGEMSRAVKL